MSIIRRVYETIFITNGMIIKGENGINREDKIPIATSLITNPTWTNLGREHGLRGETPGINHLS
jgi:hypothetical protein